MAGCRRRSYADQFPTPNSSTPQNAQAPSRGSWEFWKFWELGSWEFIGSCGVVQLWSSTRRLGSAARRRGGAAADFEAVGQGERFRRDRVVRENREEQVQRAISQRAHRLRDGGERGDGVARG